MENVWYMYENDIHGVNGLLSFPSKSKLVAYLKSDEFFELRFEEEPSEELRTTVVDAADRFASAEIDASELSTALELVFVDFDSEVETIEVEDFESLCKGESGFVEEAIELFCEKEDIDYVSEISDDLMPAFKQFFVDTDYWIG